MPTPSARTCRSTAVPTAEVPDQVGRGDPPRGDVLEHRRRQSAAGGDQQRGVLDLGQGRRDQAVQGGTPAGHTPRCVRPGGASGPRSPRRCRRRRWPAGPPGTTRGGTRGQHLDVLPVPHGPPGTGGHGIRYPRESGAPEPSRRSQLVPIPTTSSRSGGDRGRRAHRRRGEPPLLIRGHRGAERDRRPRPADHGRRDRGETSAGVIRAATALRIQPRLGRACCRGIRCSRRRDAR